MVSLSPALPYARPAGGARIAAEDDLRRRLDGLRLEQDSFRDYLDATQKEITRRDKRARFFCNLTNFAGNAVKPVAIGSLIGMGFHPAWGLGLLGSIAILAGAFAFRGKLYAEVARLDQAQGQLRRLEDSAARVQREMEPLQRQLAEIEWIKQAADVSRTLHGDEPQIRVDDGAVTIGGIRLERQS